MPFFLKRNFFFLLLPNTKYSDILKIKIQTYQYVNISEIAKDLKDVFSLLKGRLNLIDKAVMKLAIERINFELREYGYSI